MDINDKANEPTIATLLRDAYELGLMHGKDMEVDDNAKLVLGEMEELSIEEYLIQKASDYHEYHSMRVEIKK